MPSPLIWFRASAAGGCSNEVWFDRRLTFHPARNRQILRTQKFRVEQFRLIARARIAKDGHDRVARSEIFGETNRARHIHARRAAEQQAFVFGKIEQNRQGFLVWDLIGDVDRRVLEVGGDAALANPFGDRGAGRFQLAACVIGIERRSNGSAIAIFMPGFLAFSAMATPASVPPVPTEQVKPSILPSVCAQISGPVVSKWPLRLATLSN